jgi:hypothetical protein
MLQLLVSITGVCNTPIVNKVKTCGILVMKVQNDFTQEQTKPNHHKSMIFFFIKFID